MEVETLRLSRTFTRNSPETDLHFDFPPRIVRIMAKTKLADWSKACVELKMLPTSGNLIV